MATTPGAWKTWGVCSPHAAGRPCLPCLCWFSVTCSAQTCCVPSLSASASFTLTRPLILAGLSSEITLSPASSHPSWHLFSRCALPGFLCHKSGDHVCPVPVNVSCHTSSGSYGFVVSRVSWGSHPHRALRRAGQVAMFLSVSVVLRQCHHLQISALPIHFPRCPPSFYPHALMLSQGITLFCDKSHTFKREMSFAGGFFWSLIYFYKWALKWIFKVWKAFRISQKWSTEVLGEWKCVRSGRVRCVFIPSF